MIFPDTRWSQVARSRGRAPEAQAALSDLCEAYYRPVLHFLRREGRTDDEAGELAQEFFARLLAGNGVDGAEQARGKFRTFLLGAVKHFLNAHRQHEQREKRGGGRIPESLHAGSASEPGLDPPDARSLPPDAEFDRQWALTVLDRTLTLLAEEMKRDSKSTLFQALVPFLTGSAEYGAVEAAAPGLELSPAALRVAIHRLRLRYRELLREQLAQTLGPDASVEEELAALKAALRASP